MLCSDSSNDGEKDDERGNNGDYLILGHVLPHTVAVQLRSAIGKVKGRRGAGLRDQRLGTNDKRSGAWALARMTNESCAHCHRPLIDQLLRRGLPHRSQSTQPTSRSTEAGWQKPIRARCVFLNHPSADQKGTVCNAKYPKSWIVNIAAQMISIPIKARVLNLITPPQRTRIVALGEALMGRLSLF